ncbi:MAG TPA: hypothetical protein PKG48_15250, partial [Bacteroidales bacterium]|nr:hypothetical protein [Bacteroidales bacterium]
PLAGSWAGEFQRLYPDKRINLVQSAANGAGEWLTRNPDGLAILSADAYSAVADRTPWSIVVGRMVTIAVMNTSNPQAAGILQYGVSPERWSAFFGHPDQRNWGRLTGEGQGALVKYYAYDDHGITQSLSDFTRSQVVTPEGTRVNSGKELIAAIAGDPNGLGFCRLADLTAITEPGLVGKIRIVPIDKNGNGKIDFMENIYDNPEEFSRGVWIGKYPKALTGNIFVAALETPGKATDTEFLSWLLTGGQSFLSSQGYCDLVPGESRMQLDKLTAAPAIPIVQTRSAWTVVRTIFLILAAFTLAGFILEILGRYFRGIQAGRPVAVRREIPSTIDEASVAMPGGIYFDNTHTWAFREKDGFVRIGIDGFLQHVTGIVHRVELKAAGDKIRKGELLFSLIQKGKRLDILSPVTGTIMGINSVIGENPSVLNRAPYSEGWIYTVEPVNWNLEMQFLSAAEKYSQWIREEFARLRDFLALHRYPGTQELAMVTMQDGGTLKEGILSELGPEAWEDFQASFLASREK